MFLFMEKRAAALKQLPKSRHYCFFPAEKFSAAATGRTFCKIIPAGCGCGKLSA